MTAARSSRRALLKQLGLASAALSVADVPGWMLPALAQGETLVPFSDNPASFNPAPSATKRTFDIPSRLLVPGWYGVSTLKWLANNHVQEEGYLGRFQASWYRTLRGETIDGQVKWKETAIARMRVKSVIARVTTNGARYTVHGFALTDGTPVKSVEVKVDDGPWRPATLDPVAARDKYSWKLFTYQWTDATPGPHTLVSRAIDVNGVMQPAAAELENKKSFLEDNSQVPRRLTIG